MDLIQEAVALMETDPELGRTLFTALTTLEDWQLRRLRQLLEDFLYANQQRDAFLADVGWLNMQAASLRGPVRGYGYNAHGAFGIQIEGWSDAA